MVFLANKDRGEALFSEVVTKTLEVLSRNTFRNDQETFARYSERRQNKRNELTRKEGAERTH